MSIIKGQLQGTEVSKFGYPRMRVSGTWYGADKKGAVSASEGDMVEFDVFKNDRGYDTFKLQSVKKLSEEAAAKSKAAPAPGSVKDTYWADKEAKDAAKEPRISYYAASERAIQFVALAQSVGALTALAKAKDTAKLEVLTALVDEQTQRLLTASYAQAPSGQPTTAAPLAAADEEEEGQWK